MADLPGYMVACVQSGRLAFLAILVSGGIVLQILVNIKLYFPLVVALILQDFPCDQYANV